MTAMKFALFFLVLASLSVTAQKTLPTLQNSIWPKKTDSLRIAKEVYPADSLLKLSQNKIPNRLPNDARLYTILKKTEIPKNLTRIPNISALMLAPMISAKVLTIPHP